jgi:hypothetical protein
MSETYSERKARLGAAGELAECLGWALGMIEDLAETLGLSIEGEGEAVDEQFRALFDHATALVDRYHPLP